MTESTRRSMNVTNIIGNNIKTLRDGMGLSQSVIARFLNVDKSMISKVEECLSADMLEKLAGLFGVSIDTIEEATIEVLSISNGFRENNLSAEDLEVISAINRIAINSEYMAELLKR